TSRWVFRAVADIPPSTRRPSRHPRPEASRLPETASLARVSSRGNSPFRSTGLAWSALPLGAALLSLRSEHVFEGEPRQFERGISSRKPNPHKLCGDRTVHVVARPRRAEHHVRAKHGVSPAEIR